MSSSPAPSGLGLECVIDGQRFALAAESVQQIVEYEVVSPLPLARRWVGGLGVLEARVVVSIALGAPERAEAGRRTTKGVLLHVEDASIEGPASVGWALEVSDVASFIRTDVGPQSSKRAPGAPIRLGDRELPAWVVPARTSDNRVIGWIDARELVRALSTPEAETDARGPG